MMIRAVAWMLFLTASFAHQREVTEIPFYQVGDTKNQKQWESMPHIHMLKEENDGITTYGFDEIEVQEYQSTYDHVRIYDTPADFAISEPKQASRERKMTEVNFDELNSLFDGMILGLPDTSSQEDLGPLFGSVLFQIKNTKCFNLSVGDIKISHEVKSTQSIPFIVDIVDVTLDCTFDWIHDYGPGATGKGTLQTSNNSLKTTMVFKSDDFQKFPPYKAAFASCVADINVRDINFDGGVTGIIADVFSFAFVKDIEMSVKEAMCKQMSFLASTLDNSILQMSSFVESYHVEIPEMDADPLFAQNQLVAGNGIIFLDLTDSDDQVGNWFIQVLTILSNALGNMQFDENHPTKKDLGINIYFRENFLDENGLLSRTPSELGLKNDGLFYNNEGFPKTTARVTNFIVDGLDSISMFDKFDIISPQVLQTHLRWDLIEVEIKIVFDSDPSIGNPTMIVESELPHLIENVTIRLKITDVLIRFSFLTAMDQSKLFNIPFGAAFESGQLFQCILNSYNEIRSTQVEYKEGKYGKPVIEGFIGEGLDSTLNDSADALHAIYIDSITRAIPTYFATSVKAQLNNIISDYLKNPSKTNCPSYNDASSKYVDFRDLFLDAENAIKLGASGSSPYGDRSSQFKSTVDDNFSRPGAINDLFNTIIMEQSGTPGTLVFPGELYDFQSKSMGVQIYEAHVDNLDSFGIPDEFLAPEQGNPQLLRNQFSIGEEKPLHGAAKMLVMFKDDNGDNVHNELSIDLGLKEADIFFKILMNMEEKALLQFPVQDLADLNCWLATTPNLPLDKNGFRPLDQSSNFAIQDFVFAFVRRMNFNIECVSCNTPGIIQLPNMIKLLKSAGVVRAILSRSLFVIEEILNGEYVQTHLDRFLHKAKITCPHDDNFIEENQPNLQYDTPKIPKFSEESLEFTVLCAGVAAQLTLAVAALNVEAKSGSLDSLSGELALKSFNVDTNRFIDLSTFEDSMRRLTNNALQSIIVDTNSGKEVMMINDFMRSFVLDSDNLYTFKTNDFTVPIAPGFNFRLDSVNVQGLDSFTSTNAYNVIAPHTIQNHFKLDQLTLKLAFVVKSAHANRRKRELKSYKEEINVFLHIQDIDVLVSLMLALDEEKTGDIQLGSLLEASMALPCILSNTYAANVTQVLLRPGRLAKTRIEGFLSEEAETILSLSGDTIIKSYMANMTSAMQTIVRNEMNAHLENYILQSAVTKCSEFSLSGEVVDLRELLLNPKESMLLGGSGEMPHGDLFYKLRDSIKNSLLTPNENGHPRLNDVILELSQEMVVTPDNYFEMDFDDKTKLRVTSVRFENIDNFVFPIQFLQPRLNQPYTLDNEISLGIEGKVLKLWARMYVIVVEDGKRTMNEVDVSIQVKEASLFLSLLAKIDERKFKEFHLRDVDDPDCWIATIPPAPLNELGLSREPTLSVESLKFLYDDLDLDIECISCPNSDIESATALGMIFNNPQTLARFLDKIFTGPVLQERITAIQHESTLNCGIRTGAIESSTLNPNIQQSGYIDESYKTVATFFIIAFLIFSMVLTFSIFNRYIVQKNHEKWLASLSNDEMISHYRNQFHKNETIKSQSLQSKSMIASAPILLRICFILLIMLSLSFFAVSHTLICAHVDMNGHISTKEIDMETVFAFSVFSFALHSWASGSKALGIFIFIFSGICCYIKLLMTLMIWCLSPRTLSISKRGDILKWLDVTGKWSMMSIFLLIFYVTTLQISIMSPMELPSTFYNIELRVISYGGVFGAYVLGQTISHICSHISFYWNEIISSHIKGENDTQKKPMGQILCDYEEDTEIVDMNEYDPSESVSGHKFQLRDFNRGESVKIIDSINYLLMVIAAISMLFLFLGLMFPSIKIIRLGLLGLVYEASNGFNDAISRHSILSITKLLISDATFQDGPLKIAGVVGLTILILVTSIGVPYLLLALLLCIWFVPMRRRNRIRLIKVVEILKSWEYLQVYIVSLIFASWQLDGISASMLDNEYCSSIRRAFISLYYYDVIGNTSINQCLYNRVFVEPAALGLIISSILLTWLMSFIIDAAAQKELDDLASTLDLKVTHAININEVNIPSMLNQIKSSSRVQFTDTYNLFLRKNKSSNSSSTHTKNDVVATSSEKEKEEVIKVEHNLSTDLPSWATSWAPEDTEETIVYKSDEHFL